VATLSLYEVVRDQVENELKERGNHDPYFYQVDERINELTNLELLERISYALEVLK
jgi:hypothetical protein